MAYTKGEIVLSLKGRDAGKLFCVVALEPPFLRIADGKGRKLAAPKRKRETHLRRVGTSAHPAIVRLQRGESVTDRQLRRALAAFRDSEQTELEGKPLVKE